MYEVYVRERPAHPLVAVLTSGLLLIGVVVVAAAFSRHRRQIELSEPIQPPGWVIRFQVPVHFKRLPGSAKNGYAFTDGVEAGPRRILTVSRIVGLHSGDPMQVSRYLLGQELLETGLAANTKLPAPEPVAFGPLPGARISLDGWSAVTRRRVLVRSVVLHVGVASANDAYFVALDVNDQLGARDWGILERVIGSIQTGAVVAQASGLLAGEMGCISGLAARGLPAVAGWARASGTLGVGDCPATSWHGQLARACRLEACGTDLRYGRDDGASRVGDRRKRRWMFAR